VITNGGAPYEPGRTHDDDVLALFGELGECATVSHASTVSSVNIERAAMLVAGSKVLPTIMGWKAEDRANAARSSNGGRPSSITIQTLLTLMFVLALDGKGLLITNIHELVSNRMQQADLERVGLRPEDLRPAGLYQRLWRVAHSLVAVFDPYPAKRHGIMAFEEHEELARNESRDTSFIQTRKARLDWFANAILEASASTLPRRYRRKFKGNVALDATLIRTFGKMGHSKTHRRVGLDRDAGYYGRGGDHSVSEDATGKSSQKRFAYGYEATLAVQAPNEPGGASEFPLLAIGMAFHRPGTAIADEARNTMQSILDRDYPVGYFLGDLAYSPGSKAEKLQIPLLRAGYKVVSQLRDEDLGIQDHFAGAQMIEGDWYCPSMPQNLIDSTVTYRAVLSDSSTTRDERAAAYARYRKDIEQRRLYRLREKEKADSKGRTPLMCPAIGPNATVRCPLQDNPLNDPRNLAHKTLKPIAKSNLRRNEKRGKICTNKSSVSFPIEAGAKFKQHVQFGTVEHRDTYALRTVVEGYNAYAKDPNHTNVGDSGLRQLRGHAAQYLLTAILIAVTNVRKVQKFLRRKDDEAQRVARGLPPLQARPKNKRVGQYERRLGEQRPTSLSAAPPPPEI
jgi:hypothetical protein